MQLLFQTLEISLIMAKTLNDYFAFNNAAMSLKAKRLEIISGNIANSTTPGYKSRDLDFSNLLEKTFSRKYDSRFDIEMYADNPRHMGFTKAPKWMDTESALKYTVPLSPSLDNNTVEIGVEQSRYGRAVIDYQASLQFMENKIAGLRKVIKGE
jgi:flagellar basal-body rod protein FlgB